MKEFQVDITEIIESTVFVEADNEDQAYKLAMKELSKNFSAPYHTFIELQDFNVTELKEDE